MSTMENYICMYQCKCCLGIKRKHQLLCTSLHANKLSFVTNADTKKFLFEEIFNVTKETHTLCANSFL